MVWNRQHFKENTFHCRPRTLSSSQKHATLQLWLWRKHKRAGILERSRINRRVLLQRSRKLCQYKTGPPHVITSPTVIENGAAEKTVERAKVNASLNHNGVSSVSSDGNVSDAPHDLKKDSQSSHNAPEEISQCSHNAPEEISECSHNAPEEISQCSHNAPEEVSQYSNTVELDLNSADVVLIKENNSKIGSPHQVIPKNIREFLTGFHQKYGSFIPLEKSDLLKHLKEKLNKDFKDNEIMILETTIEEIAKIATTVPYFEVKYKKHSLTLDDLSTLANDNWLNDQVINMYGELIMDWAHSKVHFLNSFFHRQLMTKGYEGVKRWTKQVDLFSKRLLLVPVHLEVHWCLVTADFVQKKVCLYDSQGTGLQKVAMNILKYLLKEAKEKEQTAFEEGWTMSVVEELPQQTNENDCGIYVLEYSRCLALSAPLDFSQKDIVKIRKRIYKELCECKMLDKW